MTLRKGANIAFFGFVLVVGFVIFFPLDVVNHFYRKGKKRVVTLAGRVRQYP